MNSALELTATQRQFDFLRAPFDQFDAAQLLQHLRRRSDVHYFPVPDAEETRTEKIEAIMNNRFEFNGESHQLPEPIDWLTNPSADVEWHILLHKFYYATGLGMRYRDSGEARYAVKWMALTDAWIAQAPPGFIAADVTGRRVQNWIYAFYHFVTQAPAAPVCPAFIARLLASLCRQVNYLCENLTPKRNHRTLELYSIFLASVVFPEMRDAQRWRQLSCAELTRNLDTDLLADGVHIELSTDYHHLVVKNFLNVRRLAQLNAIALPPRFDVRLLQALEFSMYAHKPDGVVPSLSDGDARSFLDLLRQGYELYGREDMLYVATQGAQGEPPAQRAAAFDSAGYYIVRSGWGDGARCFADEQYLVFDCAALGEGNHGHFDCLSFELAAFGRSLIVDPGRYTYSEAGETNWRVKFRGTAYHNTVLVDGKNQTRYEPRRIKDASRHARGSVRHKVSGPAPQHELRAFVSQPGCDYLYGVARSAEYDAVHERRMVFAFDEYWIVCDRLSSPSVHRYDLLFHLSEQAQDRVALQSARGTLSVLSPHLLLAQDADESETSAIQPGYVSYRYGAKLAAPIVRFTRQAANAAFHTVLYPYAEQAPQLNVRRLPVSSEAGDSELGSALCVSSGSGQTSVTDYCFFAPDLQPGASTVWRFGPFRFVGSYLLLRKDAYGEIVAIHASAGAKLEQAAQAVSLYYA